MRPSRRLVASAASLALAIVAACSSDPPAEEECRHDADCHGDRVCDDGACVDPDDGSTTSGPGAGQGGGATTSSSATTAAGAAGPSSTSGPGPSSSATTSSGSGGSGGFAQAQPIGVGDVVADDLSPTGAEDYWVFSGTKGQALAIYVAAQAPSAPFDPDYIDTVLTLYDASHQPIAENDDVVPRTSNDSELLTVLPASGQYYLRVTECWTWVGMPGVCVDPKAKSQTDYQLALIELDPFQNGVVEAVEPDDTAGSANPMEYEPAPSGGYYATLAYGGYGSGTDVDWFELTLPWDIDVPQGRATGYFDLMPSGATGNGSTTPPGLVAVLDAATMTKIAEIDASSAATPRAISPPLQPGTPYLVRVQHPNGALGKNDFYVIKHYGGGSNPLETSDAGNATLAGAEPLDVMPNGDGTSSGFIEGDISTTSDLDHYWADVPAGMTHVSAICGAEREGSGLRSFTLTLLQQGGSQIGTDVESATAEAAILDLPIPVGTTKIVLRAASATKAADVSGTFYRCGLHFAP